MAKLGSYYGLCPLIDSKSLLGVSEDVERGSVIVTLGKNISIKYKLSDQKQLHSWRTKEKFTSPIIYDKNQAKYVAVFNQLYLRLWTGDEDNLDKLKKFKFNGIIHTILSHNGNSYILFKNGALHVLSECLETRKNLNPEALLEETDKIEDVLYSTLNEELYIGLVVKSDDGKYIFWTRCNSMKTKYYKIKLERDGCHFTGCTFHVDRISVYLLTMWSDGRMLSCKLQESDLECQSPGEIYTVIESISCKQPITMISLNENYIAMYGPNCNEEGALLIIYNTQFKVTQSKQSFKMFSVDAKLYCIESNLFLPVGQNLAVIPFNLDTEQLAALVGSHKAIENQLDPDVAIVHELEIVNWKSKDKLMNPIPKALKEKLEELIKQGLPECIILEQLLPEIFEKNDIKTMKLCLKHFYDIPEKFLAKMLKFTLNADKKIFKQEEKRKLHKDFPKELEPIERCKILDDILKKPFSEVLIVPHIRKELNTDDLISIFSYFCYTCSPEGPKFQNLKNAITDARFLNWIEVLFDSSYQKLVFSKDPRILELVDKMKDTILIQTNALEEISLVAPLLNEIKNGRPPVKHLENDPHKYAIEQLSLFPTVS